MLVRVQDVGVVQQQKIGNGSDQSLLVGAGNQQNSGMAHGTVPGTVGGFYLIITKNPLIAFWGPAPIRFRRGAQRFSSLCAARPVFEHANTLNSNVFMGLSGCFSAPGRIQTCPCSIFRQAVRQKL
jgi:hypothetical protein